MVITKPLIYVKKNMLMRYVLLILILISLTTCNPKQKIHKKPVQSKAMGRMVY